MNFHLLSCLVVSKKRIQIDLPKALIYKGLFEPTRGFNHIPCLGDRLELL